jgi:integrase
MIPTRTSATVTAYLIRAGQMAKRAAIELGQNDIAALSPLDLANWAIDQRKGIRPTTWRQYRSSLICYFQQQTNGGGQHTDRQSAIALLMDSDGSQCQRGKNAPVRTSSGKKRSLSDVERDAIIEYFASHPTRWSTAASIWLRASVVTGLRPSEWKTARMVAESGEMVLIVQNAKCTNGRAHGVGRTLHLGGVSSAEIRMISAQLDAVQLILRQDIVVWDDYYNGVRKVIHKATRALWPKRAQYPSLYSGRHQFAADAKLASMTQVEVAALMGHGSELTAGTHYGKRRSGRSGFGLRADPADVTRVGLKSAIDPLVQILR